MNLFVWGINLKNRETLSFILRRPYVQPFEPAILKGYMVGNNFPDMLFGADGMEVMGDIAAGLSVSDFVKLDNYHDLESEIHKRTLSQVNVMRSRSILQVTAYIYSAGEKFHKLKGGRIK